LEESLTQALVIFSNEDPECGSPELVKKIIQKVEKSAKKFQKDERITARGNSSTIAKIVIEEFCDAIMSAISASLYDREWFSKVDFIEPLTVAVDHVFKGQKVCTRLVYPMMRSVVEEAVFKYREEERIDKALWQAVELAGTQETHKKKCVQHLAKSYDEAFQKSEYGKFPTEPPGQGLIQDFVYGWMSDFAMRANDVLSYGVPNGGTTDQQILFLATLFQALCEPSNSCIPFDLASQVESMPPAPWAFVNEAATMIFNESAGPPAKRMKTGKGGW